MRAGVHRIDVTPPPGLAMAGFGARTQPAAGAHDAIEVRAIVVDDTALVTADVLGLDEAMSRRVRARCRLPDGNVVLAATHTHGGPACMPGRAGGGASAAWLQRLEDACVEAIDRAAAAAGPATITAGLGPDPDIARNRRRPDGPLDRSLPVLRIDKSSGEPLAILVSYACHPVVLGADNLLWTSDYPGFVRERIEAARPGAMAMFLTGCAGEANTGHTAQASMTPEPDPARSFPRAEELGHRIAEAALTAPMRPAKGPTMAWNTALDLALERRETAEPAALAAAWRTERASAPPFRAMILDHWLAWPKVRPCSRSIPGAPASAFSAGAACPSWRFQARSSPRRRSRSGRASGAGLPSWPPIAKGTPATSHPAANTPSEATKSTRRIAITACRPPSRPDRPRRSRRRRWRSGARIVDSR